MPTVPAEPAPAQPVRQVGAVAIPARRGEPEASLPVITHTGAAGGPVVVVTANLHGDEVTGVGVVHALDRWLTRQPLRGVVVLVPSANPQGLAAQTRHVPRDEVDLNRVFPGNVRAGWASRVAAALWEALRGWGPDLVIDLHADSPLSVPYVIVDRPVRLAPRAREALATRLEALAEASGLPVLREYPDDVYLHFGLDRSLAGCVVNQSGVAAVTIEAGPRRHLDPAAVDLAAAAAQRVMAAAGSVPWPPGPTPAPRADGPWRRAAAPRPRRAGLLVPCVPPGGAFRPGDLLAVVRDLDATEVDRIVATEPGFVASWVEGAWVGAGGVLGTLAVPDHGAL